MNESPWNAHYTCPAPSSFDQVESPAMFPTINSRQAQAHESYPSPASSIPSPSRTAQQDALVPHDQSILNAHDNTAADCYSVPFTDSSVDEGRILSGRVSRLEHRSQRRRDGFQSPYPRSSSGLSPRHYQSTVNSYECTGSRPQSPTYAREDHYGVGSASTIPLTIQNQTYRPMTPNSMTSNTLMSTYPTFDQYSNHTQPCSSTREYEQRPPSPALSISSSHSESGHRDASAISRETPDRDAPPARSKPKKAKLTNALRKEICLYQQEHPHQKQEEIAQRFGVERSTVSKILKERKTWLNIEDGIDEPPRHRPPKHPKLEDEMVVWLEDMSETRETITDAKIHRKALEIADLLRKKHGSISSDKTSKDKDETFKASAGWIENFKRRHHVKGGVWHGRPKPEEPEVEDASMSAQEPEIIQSIPDQQYIQHVESEPTHAMEIESHPHIIHEIPMLPKGVPSRDEADRAYHTLTHYLDANTKELEAIGYKPEHRQVLHEIYKAVFFS